MEGLDDVEDAEVLERRSKLTAYEIAAIISLMPSSVAEAVSLVCCMFLGVLCL